MRVLAGYIPGSQGVSCIVVQYNSTGYLVIRFEISLVRKEEGKELSVFFAYSPMKWLLSILRYVRG